MRGVRDPRAALLAARGATGGGRWRWAGGKVTQARAPGPQFSRGGAHGLGNPRGAASIFTRARLKIVAALGAEPEIAAPR